MKKLKIPAIQSGFTLIEMILVIGLIGISGIIITEIFLRTLKSSNKSQIESQLKQNGQNVLANIEQAARSADDVVCVPSGNSSVILESDGGFIRYSFTPPSGSKNGIIQKDSPRLDMAERLEQFISDLCSGVYPIDPATKVELTDTDAEKGVNVLNARFTLSELVGYKDVFSVSLTLGASVSSPPFIRDEVDALNFETTLKIR